MTHRAHDGQAIALVGHVEVAHQDIEGFRANQLEGLIDIGGGTHEEATVFEDHTQGFAEIVIVIH
jgi:hypothetical protein